MRLKYLPLFAAAALVAFAVITFANEQEDKEFEEWKAQHNKNYDDGKAVKGSGPSEKERRAKANYLKNSRAVKEHNAKTDKTYVQQTTEHDDKTDEEKEKYYKGSHADTEKEMKEKARKEQEKHKVKRVKNSNHDTNEHRIAAAAVDPDKLYVRGDDSSSTSCPIKATMDLKPVMSAVKSQGACAANWAMAPISLLESENRVNKSTSCYSDQNLVDCAPNSQKCKGGDTIYALYWMWLKGVPLEKDYKYTAKDQMCRNFTDTSMYTKSRNICYVYTNGNETAIVQAMNRYNIPMIAYLATGKSGFMNYKSGIFQDDKCLKNVTQSDVLVTIAGYGEENKQKFWLVKGTYGATWGDKGFMKIRRGTNECGIGNLALGLCNN